MPEENLRKNEQIMKQFYVLFVYVFFLLLVFPISSGLDAGFEYVASQHKILRNAFSMLSISEV